MTEPTYYAVFRPDGTIIEESISISEWKSISKVMVNSDWDYHKERGYTVQKVKIVKVEE